MPKFSRVSPPLFERYSRRTEGPCLLELGPTGDVEFPVRDCPFRIDCLQSDQIPQIVRIYGRFVRTTLVEPSSNLTARSEAHWSGFEEGRISLRRHIHEQTSWPGSATDSSADRLVCRMAGSRYDLQGYIARIGVERFQLACRGASPQRAEFEGLVHELRSIAERVQIEYYRYIEEQFGANEFRHNQETLRQVDELCASLRRDLLRQLRRAHKELFDDYSVAIEDLVGGLVEDVSKKLRLVTEQPLACAGFSPEERLGNYIGYVDMRSDGPACSSIAFASLRPPRRLTSDTSAFLLQGNYSTIFGGPDFSSSIYITHNEPLGTKCAQACGVMALSMLADRGASVPGAFDLTVKKHEKRIGETVDAGGMTPIVLTQVLGDFDISAGYYRSFGLMDSESERSRSPEIEFVKLCMAYLRARCPIVLFVDTDHWSRSAGGRVSGHAVVIVGYIADSTSRFGISSFVVHDPGAAPYLLRPVEECIEAARRFAKSSVDDQGNKIETNEISAVFTSPSGVNTHAHEILNRFCEMPQNYQRFYVEGELKVSEVRLIRGKDIPASFSLRSWDEIYLRRLRNPTEEQQRSLQNLEYLTSNIRSRKLERELCWCILVNDYRGDKPSARIVETYGENAKRYRNGASLLWIVPVSARLGRPSRGEYRPSVDMFSEPFHFFKAGME